MAEKQEKKSVADTLGGVVSSIKRIIKYAANPLILKIAIIIVAILALIGVVGFFLSLTSGVQSLLAQFIGVKQKSVYKVEQSDLIELCNGLEEMGIDLEGYGFVESITRKGAKTSMDESYTDDVPSKGEITKVTSKYLESYIISERKTYTIANYYNGSVGTGQQEFNEFYKEQSATEITNRWKTSLQDIYKIIKDNISDDKINSSNINDIIIAFYGYDNQNKARENGKEEEYLLGKKFSDAWKSSDAKIGEDKKEQKFRDEIDLKRREIMAQFGSYYDVGAGMIVLTGVAKDEAGHTKKYDYKIDNESRILEVKLVNLEGTFLGGLWKLLGWMEESSYAYDLNEWVVKYGKSTEFLVSLHLATMAPDFVYKVATSPAVDSKVYINILPINIDIELQDENGVALRDTLEKIKEEEYYGKLKKLLDKIENKKIVNPVMFTDGNIGILKEAIKKENIKDLVKRFKDFKDAIDKQSSNVAGEEKTLYETVNATELAEKVEINGKEYDYLKIFGDNSLESTMNTYETPSETAVPYIEKVVNHWYRNQYFIPEVMTSANLLQLAQYFKGNIENTLEEYGLTYTTTATEPSLNGKKESEMITAIKTYLDNLKQDANSIIDNSTIKEKEEVKKKLKDVLETLKKAIEERTAGGAYEITYNIQLDPYKIPEGANLSKDDVIDGILEEYEVQETRSADIMQFRNPIMEDNSKYIRSWLKEKYYIFDGRPETEEKDGNKVTITNLTSTKMKKYIQGKTALQEGMEMLNQCTDRENIQYLQRDFKELFEDFEFDLENVDTNEEIGKVLSNVMPSYKPYTAWPSNYEKMESGCTKMIYKGGSAELVAPSNGKISKLEDGIIEIEFTEDEEAQAMVGATLRISGKLSSSLSIGQEVKRGEKIGTASATKNGVTQISLNLFGANKTTLKVEDYMEVEKKTYGSLGNETKLLADLQLKEVEYIDTEGLLSFLGIGDENAATSFKRISLINIILNRIASPYYSDSSISGILNNENTCKEMGFLLYTAGGTKEVTEAEKSAIEMALNGYDYTKNASPYGATKYARADGKKDDSKVTIIKEGKEEKYTVSEFIEMESYNTIVERSKEKNIFYLPAEDLQEIQGAILEKKFNETIYSLNKEKYVNGEQTYEEDLAIFSGTKTKIIEYFENHEQSENDTYGLRTPVTNVVKSNLKREEKEQDGGKKEITDSFTFTINDNYVTYITMKYTIGKEGKIDSEIELTTKDDSNYYYY